MENLFFGLPKGSDLVVYDLKGSELNRMVTNPKKRDTLLDTNFKVDRNSEPIPLVTKEYRLMETAIKKDSKLLSECNVVDYSLLLIIDRKNYRLQAGIID